MRLLLLSIEPVCLCPNNAIRWTSHFVLKVGIVFCFGWALGWWVEVLG